MAKISVLVTYHNEGALLTRCLKSFVFENILEILICDDASSLPPQEFIPKLPFPCHVIRNDANLGPARSRNHLLKEASGEFIHFHDADDWVMPGWAKAIEGALASGADGVLTEVSSFRSGLRVCERVLGLCDVGPDLVEFALTHFVLVPAGTFRKTVVERMGGYRSDLWQSEDYYFNVKLLSEVPNIVVLTDPLVGIDLRMESRSQNTAQVWSCTVDALKQLSKELPKTYESAIAEMAHRAGGVLFQVYSVDKAKEAFKFARTLPPPKLEGRSLWYRRVSRISPLFAERVSSWYRWLVPSQMRRRLK